MPAFVFRIATEGGVWQGVPAVFPGVGQRLYWPLEDPVAFEGSAEERLRKFREVRDQIDRCIQSWLAEHGVEVEAG